MSRVASTDRALGPTQAREQIADIAAVVARTDAMVRAAAAASRQAATDRGLDPEAPLRMSQADEAWLEADFAARLAAVQANDLAMGAGAASPTFASQPEIIPRYEPVPAEGRAPDVVTAGLPKVTPPSFIHPGRLAAARCAADLTQRELVVAASALGRWYGRTFRNESLSRIERGVISDPVSSTLFLLSLTLGVSSDYLLGLTDTWSPPDRPPLLAAIRTLVLREARAQCRGPAPIKRPSASLHVAAARQAMAARHRSAPTDPSLGPRRERRGPLRPALAQAATDQPFRLLAGLPLPIEVLPAPAKIAEELVAAEEAALARSVLHDTLPPRGADDWNAPA